MRRALATALLLALLPGLGCGRYGPPVRSASSTSRAPAAATRPAASEATSEQPGDASDPSADEREGDPESTSR